MKKYISPKADFIEIGNTDILTASVGIDLPFVNFDSGNVAETQNADNGIKDKQLDINEKASN